MPMNDPYHKLTTSPLPSDTDVYRYEEIATLPLSVEEPAIQVMTDLRQVRVVTVQSSASLDEANQVMKLAGVRMLVVLDDRSRINGLVTLRDISGEKPIHYASQNRVTHDEICIADVMTPKARIEVLSIGEVELARVGDIIQTLRESQRQHAVVTEELKATGELLLRGIFSVTQIGRRIGIEIEPTGQVQSFSELESVLSPQSSLTAG